MNGILLYFIVLFVGLNIFVLNPALSLLSPQPEVSNQVIGYLQGINELPEMSQREAIHMQDVKQIVQILFISFFILGIIGVVQILKNPKRIAKDIRLVEYMGYGLTALLCLGCFFFSSAFVLFHKLLFTNDYWLLPADSLLIQTYPQYFFLVVTIGILLYILLVSLLLRWWRLCKLPLKRQASSKQ